MIMSSFTGEWHTFALKFNTTLETDDYIEVFIKANASTTVNFASGYLRIFGIAA
jgi:hypothetical protein